MKHLIISLILCVAVIALADINYYDPVVVGGTADGVNYAEISWAGGASGWADPNTYVALWEMETTNTTQTLDTSGNGYNASNLPSVAAGAAWSIVGTNQYGRVEHGYLFDNVDDYFDGGDIAVDGVTNMTISLWWYITETLGAYSFCAIEKGPDNNNVMYIFNSSPGDELLITVRNGSAVYAQTIGQSIIQTGVWQHVAMVFDGSGVAADDKLQLYVDGIRRTLNVNNVTTTSVNANSNPFVIGKSLAAIPGTMFGGYIDQVTVAAGNGAEYSWSSNTVYTLYQNTHPTNNVRIR